MHGDGMGNASMEQCGHCDACNLTKTGQCGPRSCSRTKVDGKKHGIAKSDRLLSWK